ncbi:hypothetical protein DS901_07895 [Loktanella sp. D2R18]|nr:hypothetical protein DS901_07895 [Loktanella sp. D2R18]
MPCEFLISFHGQIVVLAGQGQGGDCDLLVPQGPPVTGFLLCFCCKDGKSGQGFPYGSQEKKISIYS